MSLYLLLGAGAVLASLLIGALFGRLWKLHEERATRRKWEERERLLDRRKGVASRHEVLRRRSLGRRRLDRAGRESGRRSGRGRHSGR